MKQASVAVIKSPVLACFREIVIVALSLSFTRTIYLISLISLTILYLIITVPVFSDRCAVKVAENRMSNPLLCFLFSGPLLPSAFTIVFSQYKMQVKHVASTSVKCNNHFRQRHEARFAFLFVFSCRPFEPTLTSHTFKQKDAGFGLQYQHVVAERVTIANSYSSPSSYIV